MMKMSICTWNVRGLKRVEKWWGIKDFLKRWNADIFYYLRNESKQMGQALDNGYVGEETL